MVILRSSWICIEEAQHLSPFDHRHRPKRVKNIVSRRGAQWLAHAMSCIALTSTGRGMLTDITLSKERRLQQAWQMQESFRSRDEVGMEEVKRDGMCRIYQRPRLREDERKMFH
jgi:hypothetical protein